MSASAAIHWAVLTDCHLIGSWAKQAAHTLGAKAQGQATEMLWHHHSSSPVWRIASRTPTAMPQSGPGQPNAPATTLCTIAHERLIKRVQQQCPPSHMQSLQGCPQCTTPTGMRHESTHNLTHLQVAKCHILDACRIQTELRHAGAWLQHSWPARLEQTPQHTKAHRQHSKDHPQGSSSICSSTRALPCPAPSHLSR